MLLFPDLRLSITNDKSAASQGLGRTWRREVVLMDICTSWRAKLDLWHPVNLPLPSEGLADIRLPFNWLLLNATVSSKNLLLHNYNILLWEYSLLFFHVYSWTCFNMNLKHASVKKIYLETQKFLLVIKNLLVLRDAQIRIFFSALSFFSQTCQQIFYCNISPQSWQSRLKT